MSKVASIVVLAVLLTGGCISIGCAPVSKQVKEPAAENLQFSANCLTGDNSADPRFFYIGIAEACSRRIAVLNIGGGKYMLPLSRRSVKSYGYSAAKDLVVVLNPGVTVAQAVCFADDCAPTQIVAGGETVTCLCDKASERMLSTNEIAARANPYSKCMCPSVAYAAPAEKAKAKPAKPSKKANPKDKEVSKTK